MTNPTGIYLGFARVEGVNQDLDALAASIFGAGGGPGTSVVFAQSPYAVLPTDVVLYVNTAGGQVQINLPLAPKDGQLLIVKKVTSDGNTFLINPNGKKIEGATNNLVSAGGSLPAFTIRYDIGSASWWIIGGFGAAIAGAGGFDPSQNLSNLSFWSRANDLKLTDGVSVNRWPNRMGTGDWFVPSFVGVAPAFKAAGPNGLPSINFDTGGGPALWIAQPTVVPAFDPNGSVTVFVVWKWTDRSAIFHRGLTVKQPNGSGCSYVTDTNGRIGSLTNSTFVATDGAEPATAAVGVWHIAIYTQTGSGGGANVSKLLINATQKGATNAVKASDTTGNPIGLGAFYMTGSSRPDGLTAANEKFEIAEFMLFAPGLSDGDIATNAAYLAAKYNIPYPS